MTMTENTPIKHRTTPPAKTKCIIIDENDAIPPTGLFVGLNGKGYLIQPGVKVTLPIGVIEVIDNAVFDAPVIDQLTRRVTGTSRRKRYSYSVVEKEAA